jgi:hypothetical protein
MLFHIIELILILLADHLLSILNINLKLSII